MELEVDSDDPEDILSLISKRLEPYSNHGVKVMLDYLLKVDPDNHAALLEVVRNIENLDKF